MNYEIVYLNEKVVAGIVARTSNSAENMKKVIGEAWQMFFETGAYSSIPNKKIKTLLVYIQITKIMLMVLMML